jgi:hypothetical protein
VQLTRGYVLIRIDPRVIPSCLGKSTYPPRHEGIGQDAPVGAERYRLNGVGVAGEGQCGGQWCRDRIPLR